MRIRVTITTWALAAALGATPLMAEGPQTPQKPEEPPKQEQPAKQEEAAPAKDGKPAQAEDAKAGAAPADDKSAAAKPGEAPKAAVNTIEDLFAAYGLTWNPVAAAPAPEAEAVVWKEAAPAKPAPPKAAPQR